MAPLTRARARVTADGSVVCVEGNTRVNPEAAQLPEVPFRFLDLPKDIRLMIYERLEIVPRYRRIDLNDQGITSTELQICVGAFAERSLQLSCREVYDESTAILSKHGRSEPLRIITCCETFEPTVFLPLLYCATSSGACHKSTLYTILDFKDAGRRDRELCDLWGGKPSRCDFSSHKDIHSVLSNADIMSWPRRVEICIVLHRRKIELLPVGFGFKEFAETILDMEGGPFRGSKTAVEMRVTSSEESKHELNLMSDSEYWEHESAFNKSWGHGDWSYSFHSEATHQETETAEASWEQ